MQVFPDAADLDRLRAIRSSCPGVGLGKNSGTKHAIARKGSS